MRKLIIIACLHLLAFDKNFKDFKHIVEKVNEDIKKQPILYEKEVLK